jgi:hypothetical protein
VGDKHERVLGRLLDDDAVNTTVCTQKNYYTPSMSVRSGMDMLAQEGDMWGRDNAGEGQGSIEILAKSKVDPIAI